MKARITAPLFMSQRSDYKKSIAIMLFLFFPRTKHYSNSSIVRQRRKANALQLRKPRGSLTFPYEFHFSESLRYWTPGSIAEQGIIWSLYLTVILQDPPFLFKRCEGSDFFLLSYSSKEQHVPFSLSAVTLIQTYFLGVWFSSKELSSNEDAWQTGYLPVQRGTPLGVGLDEQNRRR